ncbi:hypothetical protein S101395_02838 [Bacillus sonorensis]|uniref:Uncharacterized protein n=1 Tax=Bacillus sonorensis TaxID=119858 RepID=A0ABN5AM01_9BACI|nr:hypothetical protein S101395_02838 [Bacillus sonorensis]
MNKTAVLNRKDFFLMRKIKCGQCGKPITDKTEVEYSKWCSEFFL